MIRSLGKRSSFNPAVSTAAAFTRAWPLGRWLPRRRAPDVILSCDCIFAGLFDAGFLLLDVLSEVGGNITQWSIVFDPRVLRVHFRTLDNREVRTIDLNALAFSCGSTIGMLDVQKDLAGDITKAFRDYSTEAHLRHATNAWSKWGGDLSRGTLVEWIRHLESFRCAESKPDN